MNDAREDDSFPDLDRPDEAVSLSEDQTGPTVGQTGASLSPLVTIAGFSIAALLLFMVLNGRREAQLARTEAAAAPPSTVDWSPPPLDLPITPVSDAAPAPFTGLPIQSLPPPPPPPTSGFALLPPPAAPTAGPIDAPDSITRLRAPSLVVDLGGAAKATTVAQAGPIAGGAAAAGAAAAEGGAQRSQLTDSEQFAKRVGDEEPDRARAVSMRNLSSTAPQGTLIPGVLETAINSDLPGFARAIVSRDVLSFDGKAVLIPRSSRLIGQYKSATALGQSRAFVIWTRIIRPDGVSIQIGSPGTDELGRGGLDGKVDRHFLARFSGSILLSVLNAGIASVAKTPSTQISIGSPAAAGGLAASALQGDAIPPTIKVAQGSAINVFVARDLDFSGVEPVK